jgi:hypothetical protein
MSDYSKADQVKSLDKLMEMSFKGYVKNNADALTSLDQIVSSADTFETESEFQRAINQFKAQSGNVKGSENQRKADGMRRALADKLISFNADREIKSSLLVAEDQIKKLLPNNQSEAIYDVLNDVKSIALKYRSVLNDKTNEKLDQWYVDIDNVAKMRNDFDKYDQQKTTEYLNMTTGEMYKEGEGMQWPQSPIYGTTKKAFEALSRLDLKEAAKLKDQGEKEIENKTWADLGYSLKSSIQNANNALYDIFKQQGEDRSTFYKIPVNALNSNLTPGVLESTKESILNTIEELVRSENLDHITGDNLFELKKGDAGYLAVGYANDGANGIVTEARKYIDSKAATDQAFANKTQYAQIFDSIKDLDLEDGFDDDIDRKALARLIEAALDAEDVKTRTFNRQTHSNYEGNPFQENLGF